MMGGLKNKSYVEDTTLGLQFKGVDHCIYLLVQRICGRCS